MFVWLIVSPFLSVSNSLSFFRTTISRIYYQSESNSQTVKFWGEVEGVSGSEFSLDLAQWVGVRGNGDVIDLSDENLEFDSRGNCEGIESTIICTHNPGGFLGELEVSTNAKPVGDDPKLVVRLRDINWAGRDSALQLEFDLDGCLDDVTREDGVVSEEQRCSDDRAIVDFDSTYEYLGGSGVTSFDEGKEDSDLLVLLENSKRRDELGLSFSIQVLVPEELDGNLDSDDDDNNNENGDDNNNESGDDDDDSDSGASSLGTGFSIVCSLLFSLLFLLSN